MPRKVTGPCEASSGVRYDGRAPVVLKCHRPGQLRMDAGLLPFGMILCDDCYEAIKAHHADQDIERKRLQ